MSERFESECDTWLLVLTWGAAAVCVVGLLPLVITNDDVNVKILVLGILTLTVGLIAWVNFGTYYIVDETELKIISGPFRWSVPIGEIHRITPTRAPWSSPALSLNRLRIEYGNKKQILVSPERRDEFIRRLQVPIS